MLNKPKGGIVNSRSLHHAGGVKIVVSGVAQPGLLEDAAVVPIPFL